MVLGFGGIASRALDAEGGKEGLFEYVRPVWMDRPRPEFGLDPARRRALQRKARLLDRLMMVRKWGEHVPAHPVMPVAGRVNGHGLRTLTALPNVYRRQTGPSRWCVIPWPCLI